MEYPVIRYPIALGVQRLSRYLTSDHRPINKCPDSREILFNNWVFSMTKYNIPSSMVIHLQTFWDTFNNSTYNDLIADDIIIY